MLHAEQLSDLGTAPLETEQKDEATPTDVPLLRNFVRFCMGEKICFSKDADDYCKVSVILQSYHFVHRHSNTVLYTFVRLTL